jgi:hypothetical protein
VGWATGGRARDGQPSSPFKKEGICNSSLIKIISDQPQGAIAILIEQVALIAKDQRGHDSAYFQRYWTLMWANTVTKAVARAGIAKCRLILTKSATVGMPFYMESGTFLSPTCEGPLVGRTI